MNKNHKDLFVQLLIIISVILSILFFWKNHLLSSIISIIIVLVMFKIYYKKGDIIFYICGSFFGPLAEIITTYYGAWQYNFPFFLGVPLWLIILWGVAFHTARRITKLLLRIKNIKIQDKIILTSLKKNIFFDTVFYLLLIISVSIFWKYNLLLFLILLILLIKLLFKYHNQQDILFTIIIGFIGPLNEIICTYFGVWTYANPSFLRIPIWLPLLYCTFGLSVNKIANTIVNLRKKIKHF